MVKQHSKILWGIIFLLLLYLILLNVLKPNHKEDELSIIHVIFRHGHRTPLTTPLYPKDPYINQTFYPTGRGELTLDGKKFIYKVGSEIRERYSKFLGDVFIPNILKARTSCANRNKMSLEIFLTALFPPRGSQKFLPGINWQPIPYTIGEYDNDPMIYSFANAKYMALFEEILKNTYNHGDELKYISEHVGVKIDNLLTAIQIHFQLIFETEMGLELPEWTKQVYPEKLYSIQIDFYKLLMSTPEQRRILPGLMLQEIIDITNEKIEKKSETKINIYSVQDYNMATILLALGIFDNKIPPPGSYILFEIIKQSKEFAVKVYYQNFYVGKPQIFRIKDCDYICPLNKFVSVLGDILPVNISSYYE